MSEPLLSPKIHSWGIKLVLTTTKPGEANTCMIHVKFWGNIGIFYLVTGNLINNCGCFQTSEKIAETCTNIETHSNSSACALLESSKFNFSNMSEHILLIFEWRYTIEQILLLASSLLVFVTLLLYFYVYFCYFSVSSPLFYSTWQHQNRFPITYNLEKIFFFTHFHP